MVEGKRRRGSRRMQLRENIKEDTKSYATTNKRKCKFGMNGEGLTCFKAPPTAFETTLPIDHGGGFGIAES